MSEEMIEGMSERGSEKDGLGGRKGVSLKGGKNLQRACRPIRDASVRFRLGSEEVAIVARVLLRERGRKGGREESPGKREADSPGGRGGSDGRKNKEHDWSMIT